MNFTERIRAALRAQASEVSGRTDAWADLERRLEQPGPAAEPLEPKRLWRQLVTIGVAFGVFIAAGLFAWTAFRGGDGSVGATAVTPSGYPAEPANGYWIAFPDTAESVGGHFDSEGVNSGMRVVALTNLPDGTMYDINTNQSGTCCPAVKDGQIVVQDQNGSCYGLVGDTGNAPDLSITITVAPDVASGVVRGLVQSPSPPPTEPPDVVSVLGENFENLTGDQVVETKTGKELVARASYPWPTPQCGGALPMFGGPTCNPDDFQNQLQGNSLDEAMTDVMGAISQARMCEFWSVELPPDVEAQHPWPAFADEWRAWYVNPPKDFSDAQPSGAWDNPPLTWHVVARQGDRYTVSITDHGQEIVTLVVESLPDFCPSCQSSVVPFWGVVDWTLR